VVEAALGADVEVVLQVGEIEHRLARRALAPQPFRHRLLLLRALVLDLGRHELPKPAHAATALASIAARNSASSLRTRSGAPSAAPSPTSVTMRLPITTASAPCATWRAVAPSRMPKPTPTGSAVRARMRCTIASTSRVSMCDAPV